MKKFLIPILLIFSGCAAPSSNAVNDTTKINLPSRTVDHSQSKANSQGEIETSDTLTAKVTVPKTISPGRADSARLSAVLMENLILKDSLKKLIQINRKIRNYVDSDTVAVLTRTRPENKVFEGNLQRRKTRLIVWHKELYDHQPESKGFGKWEYWVTDATSEGFVLVTDRNYKVGDKIKIGN